MSGTSEQQYYEDLRASTQQHVDAANFWRGESGRHEAARINLTTTIDNSLNDLNKKLVDRVLLRYDNARVFAKSKYMPAGYNDGGSSQSPWFLVDALATGETTYTAAEYTLAIADFHSVYSYHPGTYNTPQYSVDKSMSVMEFVFANHESTSEEIDSRLAAGQINLIRQGGWWAAAWRGYMPILKTNHHAYSALFVRFINTPVVAGATAQSIAGFGGDCSFRLNQITIFNQFNYKDLVQ